MLDCDYLDVGQPIEHIKKHNLQSCPANMSDIQNITCVGARIFFEDMGK